jgi:hypothetical protein
MEGEYLIKINTYPENTTWRKTKMVSVELSIIIEGKKTNFIGLLAITNNTIKEG